MIAEPVTLKRKLKMSLAQIYAIYGKKVRLIDLPTNILKDIQRLSRKNVQSIH